MALTDRQWEEWAEWLTQPKTVEFLDLLRGRASEMEAEWKEAVWQGLKPDSGNLPTLRPMALAYQQIASLSDTDEAREIINELQKQEELENAEHERDQPD